MSNFIETKLEVKECEKVKADVEQDLRDKNAKNKTVAELLTDNNTQKEE